MKEHFTVLMVEGKSNYYDTLSFKQMLKNGTKHIYFQREHQSAIFASVKDAQINIYSLALKMYLKIQLATCIETSL